MYTTTPPYLISNTYFSRNIINRFYGITGNLLFCTLIMFIPFALTKKTVAQALDVPFVPTAEQLVEMMIDMADVGPGDYVIDLGSGDGRIVIAAAKRGAFGHGIDIDPKRIEEANQNAQKQGVQNRVLFMEEDLFKADFSRANIITMYLLHSVNLKLRPHLLEKLRPGTRIVSHDFDMGEWKPDAHVREGYSDIFYWIIPAKATGTWTWKTQGREFSMEITQQFQEIQITLKEGQTILKTDNRVLEGERIGFMAENPANGESYIFSGRIDANKMTGTVQFRTESRALLAPWDAERK